MQKSKSPPRPPKAGSKSCSHGHDSHRADFSVDSILERLRAEGLRITPGRRKILEVFFAAGRPLSLEEIRDQSRNGKSGPDYATVFRMVTLLEKLGLVQKINLQRACSFYELHDPNRHYDHIVCTTCGKVVLISEPCPLASFEKTLATKYGFRQLSHSLEFFGNCEACGNQG
jgi:Fe2+ or Zn2+ uptake regulation protein